MNNLLFWLFLLTLIALPVWSTFFIYRNFAKLSDDKFSKKYDALYDGINIKKRSSLAYPLVFMVRRIGFAAAACF